MDTYVKRPQCYYGQHVRLLIPDLRLGQTYVFVSIWDRPFNLKGGGEGGWYGFLFRSEIIFRTTQELEYYFLSRNAQIFFPEFSIRLYDKNSESDLFFPPPKSEFFSATLGIRTFF